MPKFTYSIVGFHGTGIVPYREALAAVFMEGYVILCQAEGYVPKPLGQMDFPDFIFARSSSVACPDHAAVTRPCSRDRNWPIHRVMGIHLVHTLSITNPSSVL